MTDEELWEIYRKDWNKMAVDVFRLSLDSEQQRIIDDIQEYQRVSIRSGHARGKDFIIAFVSIAFLYSYMPSKVIATAPTGTQVYNIMMTEISKIHRRSVIQLPGEVQKTNIRIPENEEWFLEGFKSGDKNVEAWTGRHSPYVMVCVTEASGISDETFTALEGLMTGEITKMVLAHNPNRTTGEAYKSSTSSRYKAHRLNCLKAPNVIEKKIIIPGQVDYPWVKDKVELWCTEINKEEFRKDIYDFKFDGKYYRPSDTFLIKVMGEYPREDESKLVPGSWYDAAIERWEKKIAAPEGYINALDVAGMGRDESTLCRRRGHYVLELKAWSIGNHMEVLGKTLAITKKEKLIIDTIGEGAAVYSRAKEIGIDAYSFKSSYGAKGLTDKTGEREFTNLRDYAYWSIRDNLDPKLNGQLALPPDPVLKEELCEIEWSVKSDGKIKIEEKEKIKPRIGRSTDRADALAMTYYPFGKRAQGVGMSDAEILSALP